LLILKIIKPKPDNIIKENRAKYSKNFQGSKVLKYSKKSKPTAKRYRLRAIKSSEKKFFII